MKNQTAFNQEDFNHCKALNEKEIRIIEDYKRLYDVPMCGIAISLDEYHDPYEVLSSVLWQHYYTYKIDILAVRIDKILLEDKLKKMKDENVRLVSELNELKKQIVSTEKCGVGYPDSLTALFDHAHPQEWYANMGELLDTLIHTMYNNEDYYYGDVLHYVRTLEKFFFTFCTDMNIDGERC